MKIGLVKWFDNDKGFGVVVNPENEFFLHTNNFSSITLPILVGISLLFESKFNKKKDRYEAVNCRRLDNPEDWNIILTYLDKHDKVSIEVEVPRGFKGKSSRREDRTYSLMQTSAKQLFKDKSIDEIKSIITNYFDRDLNKKYFIPYCELIEGRVSKDFDPDKSNTLLKEIYNYFGNNITEEVFFYVWKSKGFKFIGYDNSDDYEINVKTLTNFIDDIELPELKRIEKYPACSGFLNDYLMYKFNRINEPSENETKSLYDALELLSKEERKKYRLQLDKLLGAHLLKKIRQISDGFEIIKSINDLENLLKLRNLIPIQLSPEETVKLEEEINNTIKNKCPEKFKAEIWYRGILEDISYDEIEHLFISNETDEDKRLTILSRLSSNQQLDILKTISKNNDWLKSFKILEKLFKKENLLTEEFSLSKKLFDDEYLNDKKYQNLVYLFRKSVNEQVSDEDRFTLFFKGIIKEIPKSIVWQKIDVLGKVECDKIFSNYFEDKSFIKEVMLKIISGDGISALSGFMD